jgi:L-ribulose-5-phosphate 4-epimerase
MLLEKYKQEVIEVAKRMLECGLVTASWGNVSVRPEGQDMMIITPSGMDYCQLRYSDMVAMDFSGHALQGERKPSSEYRMHREIYVKRPDVLAIVHTHSVFASSFAAAHEPIPVIMEELAQINGGPVQVASYALPGSQELAANCANTLAGNSAAVLLANHGLVGVSRSLTDALKICLVVEKTAQITLNALSIGAYHKISPKNIEQIQNDYVNHYGQK